MGKTLIAILERCGVRQAAIARALGVSRATVSRWGSGQFAMSPTHHQRLLAWAQEAAMVALDAARTHDAAIPARTLLETSRHTATGLKADLDQLWHDYRWESQPVALRAIALTILQRWGAYSQDLTNDAFDPKPADIDQLATDVKRLRGWIATWRRLHQSSGDQETDDGP